ncbi:hypothetical protein Q4555_15415 [Octadecabacter sp. 1_MG-2023]|nr:hypothetical protein [Octadecabacter sp. 1_MG-2023]
MWSGPAAVVLTALSGPAFAQDSGGLNANLSFSQGLVSSSEDGTYGQTNLGFTLSNVTPVQDLQFEISTGLEEQLSGGFDAEIVDPALSLSYGIENRQSALDISAKYARSDVDSFTESDDPLSSVLVLDTGTRESSGVSLGYTFGREKLFGGAFSTSYNTTSYSGTTDTDLVDVERIGAGLDLRFEITPRIAATLGYNFSDTNRTGDGLDVRSTDVQAGVDLTVSETLNAAVSVGFDTVTSTDSTGATEQEDGFVFAFNLSQDRPNGALSFNLNSTVTETGRRSDVSVANTFETRKGGEFSGSVGLTVDDNGNTNPLYAVSFSESLRRSSYSVYLNQNITSNDLGEDALNTRVGADYTHVLTATTEFQTGLDYQATDYQGNSDDTSRFDISLGISHELTQDWSVSSRYTYSVENEDGQARDTDSRLFVGLETNFGWRP